MAALLIAGVAYGINQVRVHKDKRAAKRAAKDELEAREQYFHTSKAQEASAERRLADQRRNSMDGSSICSNEAQMNAEQELREQGLIHPALRARGPLPPYLGNAPKYEEHVSPQMK